jgi:hypothetical protein
MMGRSWEFQTTERSREDENEAPYEWRQNFFAILRHYTVKLLPAKMVGEK